MKQYKKPKMHYQSTIFIYQLIEFTMQFSALAAKDNYSTSKHNQLLGWFNKNYIKSNIIAKELGKVYRTAFAKRTKSDYDDFVKFEKVDVANDLDKMKLLIIEIKKLL